MEYRAKRRELCKSFKEYIESIDAIIYSTLPQFKWVKQDDRDDLLKVSVRARVDLSDPVLVHNYNRAIAMACIEEKPTPLRVKASGSGGLDVNGDNRLILKLETLLNPNGIVLFPHEIDW